MVPRQPIYMIKTVRYEQETFYAKGIRLFSIPFEDTQTVELHRITFINGQPLIRNFMPYLILFQKAFRKRIQSFKKTILRREVIGPQVLLPFRHYLRQSYKQPLSSLTVASFQVE